jgi:hypothetical protein
MAWFEVVSPEEVSPMLLFDEFHACRPGRSRKNQVFEPALGLNAEEQIRRLAIPMDRRSLGVQATAVLLQVTRQPIGKDMVLLPALLGDQRLQSFPEEHLVRASARAD